MRVAFFTDGPEIPSSRFRCLQLFPALRRRGIECVVHYAYDERYNEVFAKPWAPLYKLSSRLSRVVHLLQESSCDLAFLHKTSIPYSAMPEMLRGLRRTPMVFDFDDAIHLSAKGGKSWLRAAALARVVSVADHVIAGNAFLADVAAAPEKTTVIPTVVDTDTYVPGTPSAAPLVIGWMGTASNFPHLEPVMPALLRAVEQLPGARLRIVSNGVMEAYESHPLVEHWRWQKVREVQALQSFDLGLMPLLDTDQTRGKCGFKMLQYMAVGVPVIASAVGANVGLFADSGAGVLVPPDGDWVAPILELARSAARRAECGSAGRAHVAKRYSVEAVIDHYVRIFEEVARRAPKR